MTRANTLFVFEDTPSNSESGSDYDDVIQLIDRRQKAARKARLGGNFDAQNAGEDSRDASPPVDRGYFDDDYGDFDMQAPEDILHYVDALFDMEELAVQVMEESDPEDIVEDDEEGVVELIWDRNLEQRNAGPGEEARRRADEA